MLIRRNNDDCFRSWDDDWWSTSGLAIGSSWMAVVFLGSSESFVRSSSILPARYKWYTDLLGWDIMNKEGKS